ncbi:MAG: MMPL family transporter [Bacteroidales bacterium]|nr:MMPL family transporter [Bacteroidales bacterium]
MHRIFLPIYRYFKGHRVALFLSLILSTLVFIFFGARLHYEEDIIKLMPRSSLDSELAFGDIGLKDKIFIQITATDPDAAPDTWTLGSYIDEFTDAVRSRDSAGRYIVGILSSLEIETALGAMDFGFEHLPTFIDTAYYRAFASALEPSAIEAQMARNVEIIENDMTGDETQIVCSDPLNLRGLFLAGILPEEGGSIGGYTVDEGHFFCPDKTVAMAFITPAFTQTDSYNSIRFARILTQEKARFEEAHPDARVLVHGTPLGAVSNAGTIKKDLALTVGISLVLILLILLACFRKPAFLGHMIAPVLYGTVFALACLYWIKGTMSLMALGVGAIVLGVALSYCLHVLIHYYYVEDVEKTLSEEATPVVLGCVTTIGAFMALLFTESELLRDFGLFASFALLGSTFFALVFTPQFLKKEHVKHKHAGGFPMVDRINNLPWDRHWAILGLMAAVLVVGIVMSPRVKFDSDLRNLDFDNPELTESQTLYAEKNQSGNMDLYFAVWDDEDLDQALEYNKQMASRLEALKEAGLVKGYIDFVPLLFPTTREQEERIAAWNAFWTPERVARAKADLSASARRHSLDPSLFAPFYALVEADYEPGNLFEAGLVPPELMSNYIEEQPSGRKMVFTSVTFAPEDMDEVIAGTIDGPNSLVLEPFYYCRNLVEIIHDDFSTTLWISSLFVFIVLLIAFRNLWVSLVAFLPMFLSWYVLQGLMAIFGLEFNMINIVISTFIFGIGVDYSIFVMEGLLQEARTGERDRLDYHKVAIFFSALVLIIVVASLIFARHPAISSTGKITLIGMVTTILLTYSLEPFLFRLLMKAKWFRKSCKIE